MTTSTSQRLPKICGAEDRVEAAMHCHGPFYAPERKIDFDRIQSGFANALHMHQPLIPAGGNDLTSAAIIGNLQHMFEHPNDGDNHNASVFLRCYGRMGDLLHELIEAGHNPRIMLEYSGCLLHGLAVGGNIDVLDRLREITVDRELRRCVEWLGMPWGHPVAPSTPSHDFRLHVRAWQHHFAEIFGYEALSRVRGFSPSEMALPNHPQVTYEFVRTLNDCGYKWVLVQEHTVEAVGGGSVSRPHVPHRLVARNASGQTASIVAIIKTQGSDTKLVGQMQPYYEARGLGRVDLAGKTIPPLVTQIADGENGGVMMNEFPPKFLAVMAESSGTPVPPLNVTEYLEYLAALGIDENDFAPIQPVMQQRIWDRFEDGSGPQVMEHLIEQLRREDGRFHMEGGSWTNDRSWVSGYRGVLDAMQTASALFAEKVIDRKVSPDDPRYRNVLFHLLCSQTSCFRYWGEGQWTDFGRELCRRTIDIIERDF